MTVVNWPHAVPASVVTNARFSLAAGVGSAVSTVSVSVMTVSGALDGTTKGGVRVVTMGRGRPGTVSVSVKVAPSMVSVTVVTVFSTSGAGKAAAEKGEKAFVSA